MGRLIDTDDVAYRLFLLALNNRHVELAREDERRSKEAGNG